MFRWMDGVVLGVFAYQLTDSPTKVALAYFARMAPQTLLALSIGTLADRFNRKNLLCYRLPMFSKIGFGSGQKENPGHREARSGFGFKAFGAALKA